MAQQTTTQYHQTITDNLQPESQEHTLITAQPLQDTTEQPNAIEIPTYIQTTATQIMETPIKEEQQTTKEEEPQTTTQQLLMDLEHESCMKQQLLRHAVQKEVDIFMQNPNCVHDLLYLDFIFTQLKKFPLLSSHQTAKAKLEEFIQTLPQFLTVSQRASKLDQQNKKLRVLVAGTFHINFKTPLEREEDRKMLQEVRISSSFRIISFQIL